jgi:hypothetical protein
MAQQHDHHCWISYGGDNWHIVEVRVTRLRLAKEGGQRWIDIAGTDWEAYAAAALAIDRNAAAGFPQKYRIAYGFITCLTCGRTSHNPNDVKHRYCGFCSTFHDDDPLVMWTVTDHPTDLPDWYVARKTLVVPGATVMTNDVRKTSTLDELREQLARMGLTPIARDPKDDPKIVEVWL